MDCAECTMHVKHAIESVPGVHHVEVLLGAEKAISETGAEGANLDAIRAAVAAAGYTVPQSVPQPSASTAPDFNRKFNLLLIGLFAGVAAIVIFGEWLGLFDLLNERVPFGLGMVLVLAGGFPVFRNVIRATLRRQSSRTPS
jgi:Cd2+/Zn2+-exporting ATPase/Cu+-exporting ATPase